MQHVIQTQRITITSWPQTETGTGSNSLHTDNTNIIYITRKSGQDSVEGIATPLPNVIYPMLAERGFGVPNLESRRPSREYRNSCRCVGPGFEGKVGEQG
jgi:hypothetical protein